MATVLVVGLPLRVDSRPRIARKAPVMSDRVLQLVREAPRLAVRKELLDSNPCEGLQRPGSWADHIEELITSS